jgi:SpoVK/Ycf46/Vps4 family AAA+-type ATPase
MDGLEARGKVIVIAATNRPDSIDPALRRPGRFDREIEIKVPDKRGRLEILQIHTRNMPLDTDVNQQRIAKVTHGFVGADLECLCKEAAMKCIMRLLPELHLEYEKLAPEVLDKIEVTMRDFENAIRETRKTFHIVEKDEASRAHLPTMAEDKVLMEGNKTLAQRFHMDIFQNGKLAMADKILAPEFVWRNPNFRSELAHGPEGAKKVASLIIESMPDRQIIHEDITAGGDKVLIRWTMTGTPKVKFLDINPSDKQITLTGFDLFRISDFKIIEIWQQYGFGRWP